MLKVSWSRLLDWEKCHRKAFAKATYVPRDRVDGRIFLSGTLADRATRKFLDQDDGHAKGQLAAFVDELWDEHALNSDEYEIKWKGNKAADQAKARALAKKVVNNLEPFLFEAVLPFEYQAEYRFEAYLKIPDHHNEPRTIALRGGMDIAVRRSPTDVRLYDLKATENEQYVKGDTMSQLIFYPMAWMLHQPQTLDQIHCAFLTPACQTQYHSLEDLLGRPMHGDDIRFLMTRIVKYAHGIWSKEQDTTKDAGACWNCDMKSTCPKWHVPVVMRNGKVYADW